MSIIFTSGWARKIKTLSEYQQWLDTLQPRDEIIVQRFLPQGNNCLNSQRECWQFSKAIYQKEVIYIPQTGNNTLHSNGIFLMSDRTTPVGDVFPQRIVPIHSDLISQVGLSAIYGHAPSFDENWINERCHVLVAHSDGHANSGIGIKFERTYSRKVIGGELHIIFDDVDRVKKEVANIGGTFLYAEYLND
jgi:hypothetical protein